MSAVAPARTSGFVTEHLDIWIPALLGLLGLIASVALAIKIPEPTIFELRVFSTVLALSAGAFAAVIPGLLHFKLDSKGLAVRGAGAIAVFLIVIFQPDSTAERVAQGLRHENTVAGLSSSGAPSELVRQANVAMRAGDRDAAFRLWSEAARNGDCIAEGNVAFAYDNGVGAGVDKDAAGQHYRKAADCGNSTAQAVVAGFYAQGSHGLPQD